MPETPSNPRRQSPPPPFMVPMTTIISQHRHHLLTLGYSPQPSTTLNHSHLCKQLNNPLLNSQVKQLLSVSDTLPRGVGGWVGQRLGGWVKGWVGGSKAGWVGQRPFSVVFERHGPPPPGGGGGIFLGAGFASLGTQGQ